MRVFGGIAGYWRIFTVIAVAAWPRKCLTEIRQQLHTPAADRLGQSQHAVQFIERHLLIKRLCFTFINEESLLNQVIQSIVENGLRCFAVASRSPGFLEKIFNGFGHVDVNNEPHVGFINPHTKSHCGHHYTRPIKKSRLIGFTQFIIHSCVINQGINSTFLQITANRFRFIAR